MGKFKTEIRKEPHYFLGIQQRYVDDIFAILNTKCHMFAIPCRCLIIDFPHKIQNKNNQLEV